MGAIAGAVIEALLEAVKAIDGTGSTQLVVAGLLPGLVAFAGPRGRRWACRWLLVASAIYFLFAVPVVANTLAAPLDTTPAWAPTNEEAIDTLVIFDGDNRRGRLRATRETLARSTPKAIWILGIEPDWFQRELPGEGISTNLVKYETATSTTRTQTAWVAALRRKDPATKIAVIVSRLQAARVAGLADAMQLSDVRIVSAPVNREPPTHGFWTLVPSAPAWRVSRDALYEHAALIYYRRHGWLAS